MRTYRTIEQDSWGPTLEQLTIGDLLDKLRALASDYGNVPCYFMGTEKSPISWHSYRGYYDNMALGWYDEKTGRQKKSHVKDVIKMLEKSLGKHLHGYKGGQYLISTSTLLNASCDCSVWSQISIVDVMLQRSEDGEGTWTVYLMTAAEED